MSNAENDKAAAINNTAIDKASIINAADWWKQAVIYQIYPRSFKDTTGDITDVLHHGRERDRHDRHNAREDQAGVRGRARLRRQEWTP